MKQQAVAIRPGWVIEFKGKPWTVTKASHIKPGKGGAFMQVEMKSVEEGTKTNERFRSEDTIEKLMVEVKDAQFLYEDSTGLTFMENETYEQFVMPADILGDSRPFLTDGMLVHIDFIDSKPVSVELPLQVICEVVETSPLSKVRLFLRLTNRQSWTTASVPRFLRLSVPAIKSSFPPLMPAMLREPNNVLYFTQS